MAVVGFSQKAIAKRSLEKLFVLGQDYKILLYLKDEQDFDRHGGHNKNTILLNIKTFKLFCGASFFFGFFFVFSISI